MGYIKGNLLRGQELSSLDVLNAAGRQWLECVANVWLHAETRRSPSELFAEEIPKLRPRKPSQFNQASFFS